MYFLSRPITLSRPSKKRVPFSAYAAVVLLASTILVSLAGCGARTPIPTVQMLNGQTMGTSYTIKLVPQAGAPELAEVSQRVEDELALVNDQMSTYIETSELSRFNASQSTDWVPVSRALAEIVQLSLELNRLTEGAFDVTVGPLVDLWGFGPARLPDTLPTDEQVAELMKSVGSDKLEVQLEPPALRKQVPGLRVDLSAIAKGHGVDRVAAVLDELKIDNYFVEIGGEVRTRGTRLDGTAWRVGIEKPVEDTRGVEAVVGISNKSLATSGDYRNLYRVNGKRYTHFIDPNTGKPSESDLASASVIADNCALADGIATGLMASGFERGLKLAEANGWMVLLIAHRENEFEVATSAGFDALMNVDLEPKEVVAP